MRVVLVTVVTYRAFDPEIYEEGLVLRLLGLLEDMEYGDVAYLRKFEAGSRLASEMARERRESWGDSLQAHHATVLTGKGLLRSTAQPGTPAWQPGDTKIAITELGRRMLRLLREPAEDVQQSDNGNDRA